MHRMAKKKKKKEGMHRHLKRQRMRDRVHSHVCINGWTTSGLMYVSCGYGFLTWHFLITIYYIGFPLILMPLKRTTHASRNSNHIKLYTCLVLDSSSGQHPIQHNTTNEYKTRVSLWYKLGIHTISDITPYIIIID